MGTRLAYEFRLPEIGEGVAEGEIMKWIVGEGEKVSVDQPIVEIMTDKVNVRIPSPRSCVISRIIAKEGEIAKVGQVIADIREDGMDAGTSTGPGDGPAGR